MRGLGILAAVLATLPVDAAADTRVAEELRFRLNSGTVVVAPGQFQAFPLRLDRGDKLEISVELDGGSVSGIGAMVCPAREFAKYREGQAAQCRGFAKEDYGGAFAYEVFFADDYVFFLDNTFASFFSKTADFDITITTRVNEEQSRDLKKALDDTYNLLKTGFEFADFNLSVAPCGELNAYSETIGGDITLCSELVFETNRRVDPDVLMGILFHELGHTLLNLWGLPNYQNEQTADEFATVLMVLSGQTKAAEKYLAAFSGSAAQAEAAAAELGDSPHPLSIQRMRNIGHILDSPSEYVRRWLPILYKNMTVNALEGEVASPTIFSNVQLAKSTLAEKRAR